ncbi:RhuM family protein, partial [Selenomonas bovis]
MSTTRGQCRYAKAGCRINQWFLYQKITDIYATALDYDRTAKTTKQFFAKVQNKMHYAVHGHTAAELIYERAD